MKQHLIEPHGGQLADLLVEAQIGEEIKKKSQNWLSLDLTPRQIFDLELLLNGGFSPLAGFLTKKDYESVCSSMKLANGVLWPIPIVLDVTEEVAQSLKSEKKLILRDPEGIILAVLNVEDLWRPDRAQEAELVYATTNEEHPGVYYLMHSTQPWYVGGRLEGIQLPEHFDYPHLRQTPKEMRHEFGRMGWRKVIAFQTRNPMHRAHFEMTMMAVKQVEANLLIHPVVGQTKPGDVDYYTRVRCYQAILSHYPRHTAMLALLPLAMRMAGPREALWHAIIRKNYGCTHLIVGRDHAGPGTDTSGKPFYGPYDAQNLLKAHSVDLGVEMVPFKEMVYLESQDAYIPRDDAKDGDRTLSISGTELRRRLSEGREIPAWFTFPEVAEELLNTYPPRKKLGFTVFFTGLSGAGKSTIAKALQAKLLEIGGRPVTLLDGDIVRKNLSSELGFSREHRDINIRRIGFVASEITKNKGIAICAPIAPYNSVRSEVRQTIEQVGGFILVYVSTPLSVCEQRDRKGLYAKARAGMIKEFTGISDPYETPQDADFVIDTTYLTPEEAVQELILRLEHEGYIGSEL